MIINSGQLSTSELLIYSAAVMAGLENAVTSITDVKTPDIALVRDLPIANGADPLNKKMPSEEIFPFSPPTAQAEDLTDQDRPFHPLVRNTVRVPIKPYGTGYYISRTDFFRDIYGTLAGVPKKLARAALKATDVQLAKLLRNGKTTLDYTGTYAFSTTKPISVNGAISGNYSNLYTSRPLTSINLGYVIEQMMGRINEDGLNLGLMPDTLIVPPTLFQAAMIATNMKSVVFSGTGGVGNLAPGQANNTAAVGDNWIALTSTIKKIVVLTELTQGNQSIDQTTWYVAETMNQDHGGAVGLLCVAEPGFEFLTNLSPSDPEVFYKDRFAWAVQRYIGTAYGVTSYLSRAEA